VYLLQLTCHSGMLVLRGKERHRRKFPTYGKRNIAWEWEEIPISDRGKFAAGWGMPSNAY
jgi:hypothetical protein